MVARAAAYLSPERCETERNPGVSARRFRLSKRYLANHWLPTLANGFGDSLQRATCFCELHLLSRVRFSSVIAIACHRSIH
jgi:hypothetical protein